MRRCGVKRSKARSRGVGRWRHRYAKYADSPSTWECKGGVFGFFHPETRFKKVRLQDPCGRSAKTMQNVRLHTEAFPCWRPFTVISVIQTPETFSTNWDFICRWQWSESPRGRRVSSLTAELLLNLMSVYDFSTVEWQHSLLFLFVRCTHTG